MKDLAPTNKQALIHEVTRALLMLQGSQEIPVEMTTRVRAAIIFKMNFKYSDWQITEAAFFLQKYPMNDSHMAVEAVHLTRQMRRLEPAPCESLRAGLISLLFIFSCPGLVLIYYPSLAVRAHLRSEEEFLMA